MATPPIITPLKHIPQSQQAQNLRGAMIMALGFFAFAACDTQAKFLTEQFHPFQIVWFRMLGLFLGVMVMLRLRGTHILRTPRPGLQVLRGAAAVGSACLFIFAVSHVPLADAVAVSFVAPFILTAMGALILKEPVGLRRWLAVAAGFCGMLIVIRPGLGVFHPAILLVVVAAVLFALRQLVSRWLSGTDSIATTVAYTSITATVLITLTLPFVWVTPEGWQAYAVILGLAVSAGLGEVLVIRALDMAQTVVLAPIHYSMILYSTFYGYVVFGDLPDGWTLVGCVIIVGSGLYTLNRERIVAQQRR